MLLSLFKKKQDKNSMHYVNCETSNFSSFRCVVFELFLKTKSSSLLLFETLKINTNRDRIEKAHSLKEAIYLKHT